MAKNDLDKFTYEDGDLELLDEGAGTETLGEMMKRKQAEEDADFGLPDPGFRAPRP